MQNRQMTWNPRTGWTPPRHGASDSSLVLSFGARPALSSGERYDELRRAFPAAHILGCSSAVSHPGSSARRIEARLETD